MTSISPRERTTTWPTSATSSLGTIGDLVWDDVNSDGIKDAGESGLSGVDVRLRSGTCDGGAILQTQTTNGTGNYIFTALAAGAYCVDIDEATLPAGASLTTATEPLDVTLTTGLQYATADFGYNVPAGPGGVPTLLFSEGFESAGGNTYTTVIPSLPGAPDFRWVPGAEGRLRLTGHLGAALSPASRAAWPSPTH